MGLTAMGIYRNVAFGQWKGCLFLHVGSTCLYWQVFRGDRCYGVEVLTPRRWFAVTGARWLTFRR